MESRNEKLRSVTTSPTRHGTSETSVVVSILSSRRVGEGEEGGREKETGSVYGERRREPEKVRCLDNL